LDNLEFRPKPNTGRSGKKTGHRYSKDKCRKILEILGDDSKDQLQEIVTDMAAKEEESPFLQKTYRILNDILRKNVKDKDLNNYQFNDPSNENDNVP